MEMGRADLSLMSEGEVSQGAASVEDDAVASLNTAHRPPDG